MPVTLEKRRKYFFISLLLYITEMVASFNNAANFSNIFSLYTPHHTIEVYSLEGFSF